MLPPRCRAPLTAAALIAAAITVHTPAARAETPAVAAPRCPPAPPPDPLAPHPPGAAVLAGRAHAYVPLLHFELGKRCVLLEFPISLAGRMERVASFPVDRDGARLDAGLTSSPQIRVGAVLDTRLAIAPVNLHLEYEHDLLTGIAGPDSPISGVGLPVADGLRHELRKAFARIALGRYAQLSAGFMTTHWGLGLVANDGDHGWEPGSARFTDPRGGDRVLRAMLSSGPHTPAGLVVSFGGDLVQDDDILLTSRESSAGGDTAQQLFGALLVGAQQPSSAGVYVVRRHQRSALGRATDVWVIDATGRLTLGRPGLRLTLEAEGALILGSTELAPSFDFPSHSVAQAGAALRATLDGGLLGGALDILYASGDENLDDGAQNAFRVDPNYETGLLLYRQVLSGHTGRSPFTAADPNLVGVPADDLERLSTRGSPTNTVAVFPRLRIRPLPGLEAYGGALFAFTAVKTADPFNTRLAGGDPHTALGGASGHYYGTEFDLGARFRGLIFGTELTIGAEAGAFQPGNALRGAPTNAMNETIFGARAMARIRL